jgi:hypothetical protein
MHNFYRWKKYSPKFGAYVLSVLSVKQGDQICTVIDAIESPCYVGAPKDVDYLASTRLKLVSRGEDPLLSLWVVFIYL